MKVHLAVIVLLALPSQAHAQGQSERASVDLDVWERIVVRLDAIPDRWDALSEPAIPSSGRQGEQVVEAATWREARAAHELITRLAASPAATHSAMLAEVQSRRTLTEVDLWLPGKLVAHLIFKNDDGAGPVIEAWLNLAEGSRRRDVLHRAAGVALLAARYRLPPERLIGVVEKWAQIEDAGDGKEGTAWISLAHGEILSKQGRKHDALRAFRKARNIWESRKDEFARADTLIHEAHILSLLGSFAEALRAYHEARAFFSKRVSKMHVSNTWFGEADIMLRLGQHAGALDAYRRARGLYHAIGSRLGEANAWTGEADVLFRTGRYDEALDAYAKAGKIYEAIGDEEGEGRAWYGMSNALMGLGLPDLPDVVRKAGIKHTVVGDMFNQGTAWLYEALLRLQQKEYEHALRAARDAAHLFEKMNVMPNQIIAQVLECYALLKLGCEGQAIDRAKSTLMLWRRWREQGVSDVDRVARSNGAKLYDLLIPRLAQRPRHAAEALALAEAAHAPVLLDLIISGVKRPEGTDNRLLSEERERLQDELIALDLELARTISTDQRRILQQRREVIDAQLELNELAGIGSLSSPLVSGTAVEADVRDALVRGAGAILLYYVAEDEGLAFLLLPSQRSPLVRRIALSRDQLEREVRQLRYELSNPLWEARALARRRVLFEQLIAPFASALTGATRVTVIPHGPLHELPFEALLDAKDTPLFARWHVTVAPSLSVLHALRQRRARRQPSPRENAFLGIAGGTGLSLPYREVADVGTWFGPTAHIIMQRTDSRGAYAELAPHARHILISSHGKHVAQSRSGYLELGAPAGVATRLTAGEIARIPLRAELVTLAACDTARGEAMQSDERLDLTRAFLIAGADAVLATRWRVPEHPSTRQFLRDFYQALHQGGPGGKGMRKDEALTEARRRSRARGDQAQLWAAWVLVGDHGILGELQAQRGGASAQFTGDSPAGNGENVEPGLDGTIGACEGLDVEPGPRIAIRSIAGSNHGDWGRGGMRNGM